MEDRGIAKCGPRLVAHIISKLKPGIMDCKLQDLTIVDYSGPSVAADLTLDSGDRIVVLWVKILAESILAIMGCGIPRACILTV